ncbi:hypothetical protein CEXT_37891 [Caerostris extrusa]|uniref:Secreted protein n=1 Tax=Caerostris extrusa TaxID=172846 RepID=A0AAV4TW38_CAEEX|nr:hypothetical protein CEXT_37891 [Caerostris extrusa]
MMPELLFRCTSICLILECLLLPTSGGFERKFSPTLQQTFHETLPNKDPSTFNSVLQRKTRKRASQILLHVQLPRGKSGGKDGTV